MIAGACGSAPRRSMEDDVLVDHRTYRYKPGTVPAFLDLYRTCGMAPQTRHLGQPLGMLYAETGELNTVVHLWAYEDAADRARRRADMLADPEWQDYLRKTVEAGFLLDQRTALMIPAPFVPLASHAR